MMFRSFFLCLSRGECVCLCVWVCLGQSVWVIYLGGDDGLRAQLKAAGYRVKPLNR